MIIDAQTGPSEHVEWDDEVTSLGRRTRRDGPDRWIVQFCVRGKMRKKVIGDGARLSADEARRAAIIAMEHMRLGAPVGDLSQPPSPMVRISEFGERFLRDMAPRWKPDTQKRAIGHALSFTLIHRSEARALLNLRIWGYIRGARASISRPVPSTW